MIEKIIKPVAIYILWIVFGVVGLFITLDYMGPLPTFELGAAFWPQVILVGIILVSVFQIIFLCFVESTPDQQEPDPLAEGARETRPQDNLDESDSIAVYARTLTIFVLPLVYVYGMHQFGFFLVTPVFLPLYMFVMGVRDIRKIVFVSAGVYASIIFLFVYLVFTPLPQGAGYFHSLNGEFLGLFQ